MDQISNTGKPKVEKIVHEMPEHLIGGDQELIDYWKQYCRLKEEMHYHPDRWLGIQSPDNESDTLWLDLLQAKHFILKKIRHLPPREKKKAKEQLDRMSSYFSAIKGKMGGLNRKFNGIDSYKRGNSSPYIPHVLELLGQFKTTEEVCKEMYEKHGYTVSAPKVAAIRRQNREEITRLQNEWAAKYEDYDIARKRGRIERLAYLVATNTDEYKRDGKYAVERSREIRALLEQVRKEIEGDRIIMDVQGKIDITATLNVNQNIRELSGKVSISNFIIALVAAKRGVDPIKLMHQLTSSYYAGFAGFKKITPAPKRYPSTLINNYDWDKIAKQHKEVSGDIEDAEVIEDTPAQTDLKARALRILREQKQEVNSGTKISTKNL